MYIEKIKSPSNIKKLNMSELNILAEEIRHTLIQKLSNNGGHVGPNLGFVEATIAMHRVFST
ncbi:MAG: 1-deoxy-D-xylulose-5-phosphate synthase, partial [Paludibacteraceae bacterium]|nr:1-deoxy-D-xylulose-5-phosphate synthase [Paludibacteraceae bacterium]